MQNHDEKFRLKRHVTDHMLRSRQALAPLRQLCDEQLPHRDDSGKKEYDDINDQAISSAIIALANSLNLRVVAEGMETEKQLWFLREHTCCDARGHFFSHAVEAGELTAWLKNRVH